jgi:hypothetical protein
VTWVSNIACTIAVEQQQLGERHCIVQRRHVPELEVGVVEQFAAVLGERGLDHVMRVGQREDRVHAVVLTAREQRNRDGAELREGELLLVQAHVAVHVLGELLDRHDVDAEHLPDHGEEPVVEELLDLGLRLEEWVQDRRGLGVQHRLEVAGQAAEDALHREQQVGRAEHAHDVRLAERREPRHRDVDHADRVLAGRAHGRVLAEAAEQRVALERALAVLVVALGLRVEHALGELEADAVGPFPEARVDVLRPLVEVRLVDERLVVADRLARLDHVLRGVGHGGGGAGHGADRGVQDVARRVGDRVVPGRERRERGRRRREARDADVEVVAQVLQVEDGGSALDGVVHPVERAGAEDGLDAHDVAVGGEAVRGVVHRRLDLLRERERLARGAERDVGVVQRLHRGVVERDRAGQALQVAGEAVALGLEVLLQPDEEVDQRTAVRDRRGRVGIDERPVHELLRHRERDAGRAVAAPVAAAHVRAVRVVVEVLRGVADVALDQEVSDADARVVGGGEHLADRREHAVREVVDGAVRPEVAGAVREEPVREGEDLGLLVGGVGGVALRGPGLREDVLEPLAVDLGMDLRLAERDVGEAVRADDACVVVRRPGGERRQQLGPHRNGDAADRDVPVVQRVLVGLEGRRVVRERLPRL